MAGDMAFVLPGNQRELRFTPAEKSIVPKPPEPAAPAGPLALGKPRVRRATTSHPPPAPFQPDRTTPYRPQGPMRPAYASDEHPTMALDREGLDVLPRSVPRPAAGGRPIPGFRPPAPEPPTLVRAANPTNPNAANATGPFQPQAVYEESAAPGIFTYLVWILASVLAGLIMFHLAPHLLSKYGLHR